MGFIQGISQITALQIDLSEQVMFYCIIVQRDVSKHYGTCRTADGPEVEPGQTCAIF